MSKSIPRYDLTDDDPLSNGGGKMELHPIGDYVEYEDHLAAIAAYEARLAEDAKVRAQLMASLQNLVAAICKVQDWDGTRVGSALDDVDAALAAAKMVE